MNTVITEEEILKKLLDFTEFKKMRLMDENGRVIAESGGQWADGNPGGGVEPLRKKRVTLIFRRRFRKMV